MNEQIELLNIERNELENIRNTLVDTYEDLSVNQIRIAKQISELNYKLETPMEQRIGIKGFSKATVEENGVIKIVINRVPEKVKLFNQLGTQYYKEIRDFWISSIQNALLDIQAVPFTEKIYLIINMQQAGDNWDVDNHNVKFIIDAIRYHGIIKNDTHRHVSYFVNGENAETEMTEIYLCKWEQYFETLSKIVKTNCIN